MTKQTQVRSTEEAPARSALKLALDALEEPHPGVRTSFTDALTYREKVKQAIATLREALAEQPARGTADESELEVVPAKGGLLPAQQEPVAWAESDEDGNILWDGDECFADDHAWLERPIPLYTSPPTLSLAQRIVLPDAITDDSESPEYRTGWNECREVMRGMMK